MIKLYIMSRKAAKVSALSSGKVDKYEYLPGEEILPSNKSRVIEQVKISYYPLGKTFEKRIKIIEDQRRKQVEALVILNHSKEFFQKSEEIMKLRIN